MDLKVGGVHFRIAHYIDDELIRWRSFYGFQQNVQSFARYDIADE